MNSTRRFRIKSGIGRINKICYTAPPGRGSYDGPLTKYTSGHTQGLQSGLTLFGLGNLCCGVDAPITVSPIFRASVWIFLVDLFNGLCWIEMSSHFVTIA